MRPVCLRKIASKFLASLPGKVWFSVWIDILAKDKFANLSKNFIFFLVFICFLFEFCTLHFYLFLLYNL